MRTIELTPGYTLYLDTTPPQHFIPPKERLEWIDALNSGKYKQGR